MSTMIDPVVAQWLEEGPREGSPAALERALAATHQVGQRPTWTFPRRWLPSPIADLHMLVPRRAVIAVLLLLLLLALLLFASFWAGSSNHIRNYLGPSGNGLIAFSDGSTVDLVRVDGSGRRTISRPGDLARTPVFSPDGARVAYIAASTPGGLGGKLVVVPVEGGAAVELGGALAITANVVPNFAWSPDGSFIAFAGLDQDVSRIYVARSDGSQPATPLTDSTVNGDLPTWSRDGVYVLYRTTTRDGVTRSLVAGRSDGSTTQLIDETSASNSSVSRLHWWSNGDVLSYAINAGFGTSTTVNIYVLGAHTFPVWSNGVGGYPDFGAPWSSDGRLAVVTQNDGVIVTGDAKQTIPLGDTLRLGNLADCWVDWAPDSTALFGGSPGGCDRLVLIPLSDPTQSATLPMKIVGTASWQAIQP